MNIFGQINAEVGVFSSSDCVSFIFVEAMESNRSKNVYNRYFYRISGIPFQSTQRDFVPISREMHKAAKSNQSLLLYSITELHLLCIKYIIFIGFTCIWKYRQTILYTQWCACKYIDSERKGEKKKKTVSEKKSEL